MSTRNSFAAFLLAATAALAQTGEPLDPAAAIRFNLGPGAPLEVVSTQMGASSVTARGGALVLDLRPTLVLRNSGAQTLRGVTLLLLAQEMTPGGRGSVAVPSLNVAPGQSFPVRINLRLLRPLPAPAGPLVEVGLDGALFADFSFFGPNRLESRRTMTAWEMEARRDREHLKAVLANSGPPGLQQEILASLHRQTARPRLDVEVGRASATPRAISAAVSAILGRNMEFAFLKLPGAPLEALSGVAQVNGAEAALPRVEVTNRSNRRVRYFEIGWLVKDTTGREFLAGSVPAAGPLDLDPGRSAAASQERSYKFAVPREPPPAISGMRGFLSQVEFADQTIWIPSRQALRDVALLDLLPVSPEEQRLSELYRTKGLQALIEELAKF